MKSFEKNTKEFKLSFAVIIRLIIFFTLITIVINYFISNKPTSVSGDPTVLGDESTSSSQLDLPNIAGSLYLQLPENSRHLLENYSKNPNFQFIQNKLNDIKIEANGFPQKQINDLKKDIINSIYHDLMKNIDSST